MSFIFVTLSAIHKNILDSPNYPTQSDGWNGGRSSVQGWARHALIFSYFFKATSQFVFASHLS